MKRKVHTKTKLADDLELHTSTLRSAGQTFFEVRHYIPSLKQYGRGVTVPTDPPRVANEIVAGLLTAQRELRGTRP